MANGGNLSTNTAGINDLAAQIITAVHLVALIVSACTFIMWFRRSYYNLHQKAPFVRRAEGWAAGGWFVPFMSLYIPYQIMRELYQSTKMILDDKFINPVPFFTTRFLGWWWGLWLINGILAQAVSRFSDAASTLEGLRFSTILGMANMVLGIVLCVITVRVIKDYANVAPMLAEIDDPETITDPYALQEAYTSWNNSVSQ